MKFPHMFIIVSLAVGLLPTFECFAPRHRQKNRTSSVTATTATTAAQTTHVTRSQNPQESEAFKYLQTHIKDLPPSGWLDWSKTAIILNALRAKKLEAEMRDPSSRTRKEHDLDWAIGECMNPLYNNELAEMYMRCAQQAIKINDSSLSTTLDYTRQELTREYAALKKVQDEAFERIRLIKAVQCLVKVMQKNQEDDDSDIEDFTDQHMFEHTRTPTNQQLAALATVAQTTQQLAALTTIVQTEQHPAQLPTEQTAPQNVQPPVQQVTQPIQISTK